MNHFLLRHGKIVIKNKKFMISNYEIDENYLIAEGKNYLIADDDSYLIYEDEPVECRNEEDIIIPIWSCNDGEPHGYHKS